MRLNDPKGPVQGPAITLSVLAAVSSILASSTKAQDFAPQQRRAVFSETARTDAGVERQLVVADFDRDGHLDLWESGNLHRNDGAARFVLTSSVLAGAARAEVLDPAPGSDPVRVVYSPRRSACAPLSAQFFENGRLVPSSLLDANGNPVEVPADDLRFVQRPRLALATVCARRDALWFSDSRGRVVPAPDLPFARDARGERIEATIPGSMAIADFDGDGDEDLVLPSASGSDLWGAISGVASARPRNVSAAWFVTPRIPPSVTDLVAVDLDADGAMDLVGVHRDGGSRVVYRNEIAAGNGFVLRTPAWFGYSSDVGSLAVGDLDGDGFEDLVAATVEGLVVLQNDGSGRVASMHGATPFTGDLSLEVDLEVRDFDGDGLLDVAGLDRSVGNPDPLRVWLGQGDGRLVATARSRDAESGVAARRANGGPGQHFVDVDGDGDLDVLRNVAGEAMVLKNDGSGRFTEFGSDAPEGIKQFASGDVDGDGDQDIVLAFIAGARQVRLNDGVGRFEQAIVELGVANMLSFDLEVVDVNGDGHLDVLGANGRQDQLFLGDGAGGFVDATAAWMPADPILSVDFNVADFDGDGDLDVHVSSIYSTSAARLGDRLYRQVGGRFVSEPLVPALASSDRSHADDFDDDGDIDLVLSGRSIRYLRNRGDGRFDDAVGPGYPAVGTSLEFVPADVDADGDLDLILADLAGRDRQIEVLRRMPTGYRRDVEVAETGALQGAALEYANAADIDGDRDADLVFVASATRPDGQTSSAEQARVLINRTAQVSITKAARVAGSLDLLVELREEGAKIGGIAWPCFASGLAANPLELPGLGTLFLDPATLFCDQPMFIGSGVGLGARSYPLPNDASLVGAELVTQALLAPSGAVQRARLTGWDSVTVHR